MKTTSFKIFKIIMIFLLIISCSEKKESSSNVESSVRESETSSLKSTTIILTNAQLEEAKSQIASLEKSLRAYSSNTTGLLQILSEQSNMISKTIDLFITTINVDAISPEQGTELKKGLDSIQNLITTSQTNMTARLNEMAPLNNIDTELSQLNELASYFSMNSNSFETRSAAISDPSAANKTSNAPVASTTYDSTVSSSFIPAEAINSVMSTLKEKLNIVISSIDQQEIAYANYQIQKMVDSLDQTQPDFSTFQAAALQLGQASSWISLDKLVKDPTFIRTTELGLFNIEKILNSDSNLVNNDNDLFNSLQKAKSVIENFKNINSSPFKTIIDITKNLETLKSSIISAQDGAKNLDNLSDLSSIKSEIDQLKKMIVDKYKSSPELFIPAVFARIYNISNEIINEGSFTIIKLNKLADLTGKSEEEISLLAEQTNKYITTRSKVESIVNTLSDLILELDIAGSKSNLIIRINACGKDLKKLSTSIIADFGTAFKESKILTPKDITNNILNTKIENESSSIESMKLQVISKNQLEELKIINSNLYSECTKNYANILSNLGKLNLETITSLGNEITNLRVEKEELETKKLELTTSLNDSDNNLKNKIITLNDLEKELEKKNNELELKKIDYDNLNNEFKAKSEDLIKNEGVYNELFKTFEATKEELKTTQSELLASQNKFTSSQNQLSNLQQEFNSTVDEKKALESKIADMDKSNKEALEALNSQLAFVNKTIDEQKLEITTLSGDLKTQAELLASTQLSKDEIQKKLIESEAKYTNLVETSTAIKADLTKAFLELANSLKVGSVKELDLVSIKNLTDSANILTGQLFENGKTIETLNKSLDDYKLQLDTTKAELNAQLAKKSLELSEILIAKNDLTSQLAAEKLSNSSNNETLNAKIASLDIQIASLSTEVKDLELQTNKLTSENKALSVTNADLSSKLIAATKENLDLNKLLDDTNNASKIQLDTATASIASLKDELSIANTSLQNTKNTLTSTQNTLTSTQNTLTSTQNTLTSTQNTLTSTQNTLTSTQSTLTSTQNTLTATQNTLSVLKGNLNTFLNSLNSTLGSANAFIGNYTACTEANFNSCFSSVSTAVQNLLAQTNALNKKITDCLNNSRSTFDRGAVRDYDTDGWSTKLYWVTFHTDYCPSYMLR